MKECEASLFAGQLVCSKLSGKKCAVLQSEGLPDGNLNALPQFFKSESTGSLEMYKRAHSSGGSWVSKCVASSQILEATTSELDKR